MKPDRLKVVLQVRETLERRRLAEQASAEREASSAAATLAAADAERRRAVTPPGDAAVGELHQRRLGGLALNDAVERAQTDEQLARRELDQASERRKTAAIARRSTERLHERRTSEAATRAARIADKQLDAIALETWRRRS